MPLLRLGMVLAVGKPKTDGKDAITQIVGKHGAEAGPPETSESAACEGEQNMPPQQVPLWDYSKVKVIQSRLKTLTSPSTA